MPRKVIPLAKEVAPAGFAVCYAGAAIKHKRGGLYEVDDTKRREVSLALCITKHFGRRCNVCPFSEGVLRVRKPD